MCSMAKFAEIISGKNRPSTLLGSVALWPLLYRLTLVNDNHKGTLQFAAYFFNNNLNFLLP